jgi:hypothetical protein
VFVDTVQAKLIRGSLGAPTLSRQFSTEYLYFDNQYLNDQGVAVDSGSFRLNNTSKFGAKASSFGEGGGVDVFPSGTFADGARCYRGESLNILNDLKDEIGNLTSDTDIDDVQSQIDAIEASEPCKWEYTKGQELSIFGTFSWLFRGNDDATLADEDNLSYIVTYLIGGKEFVGAITSVETPTGFGTLFPGTSIGVDLAADALDDLVAGEYDISVEVEVSSNGNGKFFKRGFGPDIESDIQWADDETCKDNPKFNEYEQFRDDQFNATPDDSELPSEAEIERRWLENNSTVPLDPYICGIVTADDGGEGVKQTPSDRVTFYSATERMIIVGSNNDDGDDEVRVSSPGHLSLLLFGLSFICLRRFKRKS